MKLRAFLLALTLVPSMAFADGRELATKNFRELQTMTNGNVSTSADFVPVYDASARQVKKIAVGNLPAGTTTTFSTTQTGNPLQYEARGVLTIASVNAGTNILESTASGTIYPGNFMLMASGSVTTATGIYLRCRGSNNVISSVPIAMLTDLTPVGPFKSSGAAGTATPTLGSSLVRGCAAGDAVYISNTGSAAAGATHIYYSLPYVIQ